MTLKSFFIYPHLAQFGSHHERRYAIVVEHRLQVAVWVKPGSLDEQQVIHLCEESRAVLGVVCNVHEHMQHRVSAGILAPQVGLLVRILGEVVHYVGLVRAGSQGERQLTWANRESERLLNSEITGDY